MLEKGVENMEIHLWLGMALEMPLLERWHPAGRGTALMCCCGPLLLAVFAFSSSYAFLLIARSLQGIGSSCSSVAGTYGDTCVWVGALCWSTFLHCDKIPEENNLEM